MNLPPQAWNAEQPPADPLRSNAQGFDELDPNDRRIHDVIEGVDDATDPFSQAVRATRMPMVITNPRLPDNPVVFANEAFCRLSGYTREEILGRNCRFLQGPETDPATVAILHEAVHAGRPVQLEILNYRKNGDSFWNRLLLEPVFGSRGQLAYFFASQVDVTLEREKLAGLEHDNAALMATLADKLREEQDSQSRFRFATEAGGFGVWELDLRSMQFTASPTFYRIHGFQEDTRLDFDDVLRAVHPDDLPLLRKVVAAATERGENCDVEYRIVRTDGASAWVSARAQVSRTPSGDPHRLAGILTEITARKQAEARSAAQAELSDRVRDIDEPARLIAVTAEIVGRALDLDHIGYGRIDLQRDTLFVKLDWKKKENEPQKVGAYSLREFGGFIDKIRKGEPVAIDDVEEDPRTAPYAAAFRKAGIRSMLNIPLVSHNRAQVLLYLVSSGVRRWATEDLCFVREIAERTRTAVRSLSLRRRSEMQLQHLAHHDPLTGLPNRLLLAQRLQEAECPSGEPDEAAVLYVDLDRFKPVNDLFGHDIGDGLLLEVSKRLRTGLRPSDTLARIGGDEFAIVLPRTSQAGAVLVAERLLQLMREPFDVASHRIAVGISVGIASSSPKLASSDKLLRCADIAMYRVKQNGGGAYCIYETAMNAELFSRRSMEHDLRDAIERNQLTLNYQPIFDCQTGAIFAFEALLRWQHPDLGFISPAEFIPAAEECGLIVPLGRWALETACAQAAGWSRPLRIAVNLSPIQFRQADFAETLFEILDTAGLPAERLELEVTENSLIDNPERAMNIFGQLKQRNICIALDDFGTGFSSLSYLQRFPFDTIKIDRAFVKGLADELEARAIVRAIITLARTLNLAIVAEGVETSQQFSVLKHFGCNRIQGYFLGRPVPAEQVEQILQLADGGHHMVTAEILAA